MYRIYLCGPFHREFFDEENRLLSLGYEVINPAEIEFHGQDISQQDLFRELIDEILTCDAMAFVDGWEGFADLEVKLAQRLGITVFPSRELTTKREFPT